MTVTLRSLEVGSENEVAEIFAEPGARSAGR